MVDFVQSYLRKQNDQYKRDKDYISTMYDTAENMDGTVVKLQGETGWNNYERNIGDPAKQSTLVVRGHDQNIYLFFKHAACQPTRLYDGVDILDSFCYTKNCKIYRRREPAEVPTRLKELVVDADCAGCTSDDSTAFLTANFVEGGIMPIKDMIAHPDWKQKYRHQLKTKRVHTCVWCKSKAQKGCCAKYSSGDRIKVTMVVGWQQKTYS